VSARISELHASLNASLIGWLNVLTNIGYNLDYKVAMVISFLL